MLCYVMLCYVMLCYVMYACMYVCMYVCNVCMYVCMYVCMLYKQKRYNNNIYHITMVYENDHGAMRGGTEPRKTRFRKPDPTYQQLVPPNMSCIYT